MESMLATSRRFRIGTVLLACVPTFFLAVFVYVGLTPRVYTATVLIECMMALPPGKTTGDNFEAAERFFPPHPSVWVERGHGAVFKIRGQAANPEEAAELTLEYAKTAQVNISQRQLGKIYIFSAKGASSATCWPRLSTLIPLATFLSVPFLLMGSTLCLTAWGSTVARLQPV